MAAFGTGRRDGRSVPWSLPAALAFGQLLLVMVLVTPFSHNHYGCLAVPQVMALYVVRRRLPGGSALGRLIGVTVAAFLLANLVPRWPQVEFLRDILPGLGTAALSAVGLAAQIRLGRSEAGGGRAATVGPRTASAGLGELIGAGA